MTWLGTWEGKLRVKHGKESLKSYSDSPEVTRQFGQNCGSQLFFRCTRWPDGVHVTRASILGPADRAPQAHVYFSDKADWFDVHAQLALLGGENGVTPIPDSTTLFAIELNKDQGRAISKDVIDQHIQHLKGLHSSGRLVLCGPFSDHPSGLVIVRAKNLDEAISIASSDPFVQGGYSTFQLKTWMLANEGNNYLS